MDLSKKRPTRPTRPTRRCRKDTAGLADYTVTEGQQLDGPLVHAELRSWAGTFASPEIGPNQIRVNRGGPWAALRDPMVTQGSRSQLLLSTLLLQRAQEVQKILHLR